MADSCSNIRNPKLLSEGDICRPVTSGKALIQECGVQPPLPCIVILVHGVNDVGEAYENQDVGICAGLNTRLGRTDMHHHEWKQYDFMISDADGNITTETCAVQDQTCVGVVNRYHRQRRRARLAITGITAAARQNHPHGGGDCERDPHAGTEYAGHHETAHGDPDAGRQTGEILVFRATKVRRSSGSR